MSNTIEFKGEIYQIGKEYLFSDKGRRAPTLEKLTGINFNDRVDHPFVGESGAWKWIKAIDPATLGTIEKAKLKPKNGEWWMLDFGGFNLPCLYKNNEFYEAELNESASEQFPVKLEYKILYPMIRNNGGNDE